MKFPMTPRGGLKTNPRGAHVVIEISGNKYLGEVRGAYFDDVTGTVRLDVRFFNGESWPFDPPARSVEVLDRSAE